MDGLPSLIRGMIMAFRKICGMIAPSKFSLKRSRRMPLAIGSSALINWGGISLPLGAPLPLIFLNAVLSSWMVNRRHWMLLADGLPSIHFAFLSVVIFSLLKVRLLTPT